MKAPERVRIGQIVAPHGVRGALRVLSLTDFPERWAGLSAAFVGDEDEPRAMRCTGFARRDMPLLTIAGVRDRDGAERLSGQYISVPAAAVHPLPPDTYYLWQLAGLRAVGEDGVPIGTVTAVLPNPGNDLLVVQTPDGRNGLVPCVREFVRAVDLTAGTVTLRLIPGLLE